MSPIGHIAVGDMHVRFVATEPEILVVINVREDCLFADGTMAIRAWTVQFVPEFKA
jgi:hypothetical protein